MGSERPRCELHACVKRSRIVCESRASGWNRICRTPACARAFGGCPALRSLAAEGGRVRFGHPSNERAPPPAIDAWSAPRRTAAPCRRRCCRSPAIASSSSSTRAQPMRQWGRGRGLGCSRCRRYEVTNPTDGWHVHPRLQQTRMVTAVGRTAVSDSTTSMQVCVCHPTSVGLFFGAVHKKKTTVATRGRRRRHPHARGAQHLLRFVVGCDRAGVVVNNNTAAFCCCFARPLRRAVCSPQGVRCGAALDVDVTPRAVCEVAYGYLPAYGAHRE